jgi:hypothetical protein
MFTHDKISRLRATTISAITTSVIAIGVITVGVSAALTGSASASNGAPATTQFDGVYAGESVLTGGWGYVCGAPSYPVSVSVKDGRFDYTVPIVPTATPLVPVQIAANGSLNGQALYAAETFAAIGPAFRSTWVTIVGHTTGQQMDAEQRDYRCVRHMVLQRQG